jgi:4-amino-4-deoxy-L-arabinose transferase-like glycosyltransferase
MSIFTPAVLLILAIASFCALATFRIRSLAIKRPILGLAVCFLLLATWLAAIDAWSFRDGFQLPSPRFVYIETHGIGAARAFLRHFWVSLLGAGVTAALITTSWRQRRS